MKKLLLATLCVGLPALVMSCSSDSGEGTGSTGGSSSTSTSSVQGGSAGKSSGGSSASGGSSSSSSSSSSSGGAGSSGGSSSATSSGGKTSSGGSTSTSSKGGTTGTGGSTGTGGTGTATGSGGTTGTGGTKTGGSTGTGTATGGSTGTGGTATGGSTGTGGTATGGSSGTGGASGTGGSTPSGDVKPSKGCGVTDGLKKLTTGGSSVNGAPTTSTRLSGVKSGGKTRAVILDVPADYDPTKPYRLIFSWRQMGGSDTGNATGLYPANNGPNFDAKSYAYFGLRREALNANQPAIFVAPDTDPIGGNWNYTVDKVYFDDLLQLMTENLCIDENRVFTTGFSFGAMMSYALSIDRATKLRAAVTMAPANYNLPGGPTPSKVPLAYMSSTGMADGMCPWGDDSRGGKACVIQHAKDNGCTIPATLPEVAGGSKKYVCYDFEGCKAGYPVKMCRFDGGHTPSSISDGVSAGDDGLKAFFPPLAWKFISQF